MDAGIEVGIDKITFWTTGQAVVLRCFSSGFWTVLHILLKLKPILMQNWSEILKFSAKCYNK